MPHAAAPGLWGPWPLWEMPRCSAPVLEPPIWAEQGEAWGQGEWERAAGSGLSGGVPVSTLARFQSLPAAG